jgi:hypothetical protein
MAGRNLDSDCRVSISNVDFDDWKRCLEAGAKQITRATSTGTPHALSDDIGESK